MCEKKDRFFLEPDEMCALRCALEHAANVDELKEFVGPAQAESFIHKALQNPHCCFIELGSDARFFFGSILLQECHRIIDDPAVVCAHTAHDHLVSLLYLIDVLEFLN